MKELFSEARLTKGSTIRFDEGVLDFGHLNRSGPLQFR